MLTALFQTLKIIIQKFHYQNVRNLLRLYHKAQLSKKEKGIIQLSLRIINHAFETIDSPNVLIASRFVRKDIRSDIYVGTNTFPQIIS